MVHCTLACYVACVCVQVCQWDLNILRKTLAGVTEGDVTVSLMSGKPVSYLDGLRLGEVERREDEARVRVRVVQLEICEQELTLPPPRYGGLRSEGVGIDSAEESPSITTCTWVA